jgi:uncharacterized protein (TIGR00251 family)
VIRQTANGVEIEVRVIPRASRSAFAGERDGRLLVRLAAAPVEGAANDALVELCAQVFARPRRSIRIVAGEKSRSKRIAVDGITVTQALEKTRAKG